jgi:hypothetical protein
VIFRPELARKVLGGDKTQTRRLVSENPRSPWGPECGYHPGGVYALQPGRGKPAVARIAVLKRWRDQLGAITHEEAVVEGFANRPEFFDAWEEINGSCDHSAAVWVLSFQLVSITLPGALQL